MATIYREFVVDTTAERAWDAIRDFGAVHNRFATGFVTNVTVNGMIRTVTFANGFTVKEQIIAVDDEYRRLAYTSIGGRATHHNAYFQVFDHEEGKCRIAWVTDLLPNDVAEPITQMVDTGIEAIKKTLAGSN